jgi:hypothetical protein
MKFLILVATILGIFLTFFLNQSNTEKNEDRNFLFKLASIAKTPTESTHRIVAEDWAKSTRQEPKWLVVLMPNSETGAGKCR